MRISAIPPASKEGERLSFPVHRPILLLLLAPAIGCLGEAPAPEVHPDLDIPPAWTGGGASPGSPRDDWWKTFADPALENLLAEGLRRNHALGAAAERLRAAAVQARIAGADLWPQVSGAFDGGRTKRVFVGFPIPGSSGPLKSFTNTYGVSLDLTWEIDLWGRIRAGRNAALKDFEAKKADLEGAQLSLSGQIAKAWFALREATAQVELAERTAANNRRTVELTKARYASGRTALLDLELLKQRAADSLSAVSSAKRAEDAARRQLEILIGRYPKGLLPTASDLPPLPPLPPAGIPASVLDRRPDLRAAAAEVLADLAREREARASLYPRISLTTGIGTRSDELGDLIDGDFSVWNLAGNLLAPIFQGGRLRARVALQESATRERLERFADQALQAFKEVETALAAEDFLKAERAALAKSLEASERAYDLARERYLSGRTDVLQLLDAERSTFAVRSRLLRLDLLALTNRIDLHLALGGSFPRTAPPGDPVSVLPHEEEEHE